VFPISFGFPPNKTMSEKFPVLWEVKVGVLLLDACFDKNITMFSFGIIPSKLLILIKS
jgi:hypothetical protein